jgi:hypothetical protein
MTTGAAEKSALNASSATKPPIMPTYPMIEIALSMKPTSSKDDQVRLGFRLVRANVIAEAAVEPVSGPALRSGEWCFWFAARESFRFFA